MADPKFRVFGANQQGIRQPINEAGRRVSAFGSSPNQQGVLQPTNEAGRRVQIPDSDPALAEGPAQLTAESFSPGVTEVVGGTGSRLFTNLIEPDATPEQATGFGQRVAAGTIPVPDQLGTAKPFGDRTPLAGATQFGGGGDQSSQNRLINASTTPEPGTPNGFGEALPIDASLGDLLGAGQRRREAEGTPRTIEQVLRTLPTPSTPAGARATLATATEISNNEVAQQVRGQKLGFAEREATRQEGQLAVNQEQAKTQAKQAETAAAKEVAKTQKDTGLKLKPVFEELPLDPANPLLGTIKTLTSFSSEGGANPVSIPLADMNAYRRFLDEAGTPEEKAEISRQFKAKFSTPIPL